MFKPVLAAALIVGAASSAAFAQGGSPVIYYFDTANGARYCDGLLLTQKSNILTGYFYQPKTNSCPRFKGDDVLGFYADGFGPGAMGSIERVTPSTYLATITAVDQQIGGTNIEPIYNLDIKNKLWVLFVVGYGDTPINGGPLSIGKDEKDHPLINRPRFQK
jgi:hypothetical protein